jgi:thiamine transport system ATP-binding protein
VNAPGLELEGVRFGYGDWQVAYDLAVPQGSFTALLGASGAGKSTLLSLVAGFETPDAGIIRAMGEDITALPPSRRPVTTLFQEHNLFPHLTVDQNVGLGIDPGLRLAPAQTRDIEAALERVGLAAMGQRLPRELSGGERQRVAIARSLVRRRPLLLLDEPFAALGPALRRDMLDLVAALGRDNAMTVIMVSHDPADALRVADRTAFIQDGSIAAFGPTRELLDHPDLPALADYLGV